MSCDQILWFGSWNGFASKKKKCNHQHLITRIFESSHAFPLSLLLIRIIPVILYQWCNHLFDTGKARGCGQRKLGSGQQCQPKPSSNFAIKVKWKHKNIIFLGIYLDEEMCYRRFERSYGWYAFVDYCIVSLSIMLIVLRINS